MARPARLGQDCTPGFARTGPRASLPPCFPSRPSVSSDEPTHSRGHRLKRPSVYKFYMSSISLRSSIAGWSGLDLLTRVANAYEVPLAGMYSWKIEKGLSTSRRSRIPKCRRRLGKGIGVHTKVQVLKFYCTNFMILSFSFSFNCLRNTFQLYRKSIFIQSVMKHLLIIIFFFK